jgi:hypothetical protein
LKAVNNQNISKAVFFPPAQKDYQGMIAKCTIGRMWHITDALAASRSPDSAETNNQRGHPTLTDSIPTHQQQQQQK